MAYLWMVQWCFFSFMVMEGDSDSEEFNRTGYDLSISSAQHIIFHLSHLGSTPGIIPQPAWYPLPHQFSGAILSRRLQNFDIYCNALLGLLSLDKQIVNTDLVLVLQVPMIEDSRMFIQVKLITRASVFPFLPSQDQTDLDEFLGYLHHRLHVQMYCRVYEQSLPLQGLREQLERFCL